MKNPLLENSALPDFDKIQIDHIEPAIDTILMENRHKLTNLLSQKHFTWENLLLPLEYMENYLDNCWSPINHLNSVCNREELRTVYQRCLEKLTIYSIENQQNELLYQAINSIYTDKSYQQLSFSQKKLIEDRLLDFRLAGVALPSEKKEQFKELDKKLSEKMNQFENNVVDATDSWYKHLTDDTELAGLPAYALDTANLEAKKRNLPGFVFTLEFPSYIAVMTYAESSNLRKELYTAYVTRASDQGPFDGQFDNTLVMEEILKCRHQMALLLGYNNYAELSLATKMADDPDKVIKFLNSLAEKARPLAQNEFHQLQTFAKEHFKHNALQSWDIAYFSEKLKHHLFDFTDEQVRGYFQLNYVLQGLFDLVKQLFGLTIQKNSHTATWHPDVQFFELYDEQQQLRGQFYIDLFARSKKRGGAWVGDCRTRCRLSDGSLQIPVAFITCNFTAPLENQPTLLSHDEVITLFHEFGHALHHMLTKVDYPSIAGTNGVEWDAVELPSQFMENWCWEKQVLDLISHHYQTGRKLPLELYQKMLAAKNFQAALALVRQIEFSLFDFRLHLDYQPNQENQIQSLLNQIRNTLSVIPYVPFNRFQNSFSHIFGGGYAAGYYSYKWAEVMSSDAFAKFEETGLFCQETAQSFLHTILEMGGSKKALELFISFRNREPTIDALLRHSGLAL